MKLNGVIVIDWLESVVVEYLEKREIDCDGNALLDSVLLDPKSRSLVHLEGNGLLVHDHRDFPSPAVVLGYCGPREFIVVAGVVRRHYVSPCP